MKDINEELFAVMRHEQCSSIRAFFLLMNNVKGDKDELCELQSKSCEKTGGRLRDKSDIKKPE